MKNDEIELGIKLELCQSDANDLDRISNSLYEELRNLQLESIERTRGGRAPKGSKTVDAALIGEWIVKMAVPGIPAFLTFLKDWKGRQSTVPLKIKVQRGRRSVEIEYDPSKTSPAKLDALVKRLLK